MKDQCPKCKSTRTRKLHLIDGVYCWCYACGKLSLIKKVVGK